MHFVYILFSSKDRRLYVGMTSDIKKRINAHRKGFVNATRNRLPVRLIHFEAFCDRREAARRERYLKGGNGRKELKNTLALTLARLEYPFL